MLSAQLGWPDEPNGDPENHRTVGLEHAGGFDPVVKFRRNHPFAPHH
jgi:hypothetical protein